MKNFNSFEDQGYQIFKNAIPSFLIDKCLSNLEKIKKRKTFLYYSQSTHRWIRPKLSRDGFLINSILNPTLHGHSPLFANSVKEILYSDGVYNALHTVARNTYDFVAWQDMAFDQSTGTIDHIDSWYLDTEYPGGVIGVWIALEDISIESGPFFVCPGSHRLGSISKKDVPHHDKFLSLIKARITEYQLDRKPMLLKKGDILLWNSLLIHGAFAPTDAKFSRKSLTSHFYPLGMRRNDGFHSTRLLNDLSGLKVTTNSRIFRLIKPGRSPFFYAFAGPLLALKDRIGIISSTAWNMRR